MTRPATTDDRRWWRQFVASRSKTRTDLNGKKKKKQKKGQARRKKILRRQMKNEETSIDKMAEDMPGQHKVIPVAC